MSTAPNPIAGAGSNAEPIIPDVELESDPALGTEVQDTTTDVPEEVAEGDQPTPEESQQTQGDTKEDGRVIPKWMKELQAANPEAYKKAKTDLFELRDRRGIHPTAQDARKEHDLIQSYGGEQGLSTLREDAVFFKEAATQFKKGDPLFVKDLWEEDPIAAALHVQPMLEAYRERDKEGYNSAVCRLWDQEFQSVGFGNGLKVLADAIKAKDWDTANQVVSGPNGIIPWYNSIGDVARKAEDPRVKTLLAERARQQENQQKSQQEEFYKSYRTEAINAVSEEGAKVFDSFFKGRKMDAEDRTDLLREALSIANRAVSADKMFTEDRQKHLDRGDSHSALQLTKARYAREMTDAVKRVARRYGLVSGTPGNSQQRQQEQKPPNTQTRTEPGWTAVNVRPEPGQIDRTRTTNDMILQGRAILAGGKKVDWSGLKKKGL